MDCYPFVNEPLSYGYGALEPYIDEKTMTLHHDRHLKAYVDNLNKLMKNCAEIRAMPLCELLCRKSCIPKCIREAVMNNAGGVYNHRFFFDGMRAADGGGGEFHGELLRAIKRRFGSAERFFDEFKNAAMSVFGSGYAWLVCDRERLSITTTENQDTPLERGERPILNIDVWEHAYYLKNYNMRADYIENWFHVVNADVAERRFKEYLGDKIRV